MTGTKKFKLTVKTKLRLSHRNYAKKYGDLKCYKCQRSFNIDETIVATSAPRKYHCLPCAKALNII